MSADAQPASLARSFLGKLVRVTIDRPLGSRHPSHGFRYTCNYGFVEGVPAPDGEFLDAYVLQVDRPVKTFDGRCVAVVHRLDDDDDKLIVVPDGRPLTDEDILIGVGFVEQHFETTVFRE